MNSQFTYVDASNSYVVARSPNEHDVSASPSFINNASNCMQQAVHDNFYASNSSFSNMQHMYPNPHASATPQIHMPVDNMMGVSDQYMAPHVQEGISQFCPSVASSQYAGSSPNMPMDGVIGHASISYSANYPQPSYATPCVTNFSAPCETGDIHNSALHLGYIRISGDSKGAQVHPSSVVAAKCTLTLEELPIEYRQI